jgi:peptidoglycan/xylan/chitin deacetylase (PgdA/CDA1 family)
MNYKLQELSMTKQKGLFKLICTICLICFIILASAPLITLAIPTIQLIPLSLPATTNELLATAAPGNTTVDVTVTPEYDTFTVAEREEKNLPKALPPREPYYGNKIIYLTFDDGPDFENTPLILTILKENNVKATFFVLGTEVLKYPELLKRTYEEGHAIGNHSYNHIYKELYQSPTTYTEQLQHTDQLIKNLIHVRPHISRAPGGSAGSFTTLYWDALKTQGYIEVGWNISSGDASNAKADKLVSNIMQQTENNKFLWSHAILLMHDGRGHGETVKALPQIIKYYKQLGFEFHVITGKTPPAW